MRTTNRTTRGVPLVVLLLLLAGVAWGTAAESGIQIHQAVEPDEIYVVGTEKTDGAAEELATLTLGLQATGPAEGYPIDCVLVIDTSATSDLGRATEFAFDLIDRFKSDDRIGLVSYATTATLDVPLTNDRSRVKAALAGLASGGKSALGLALQVARQELQRNARKESLLVAILLCDGQSNVGVEPEVEGEVVEEAGITIITVGIGTLINRTLLEELAAETNGRFFLRPMEETPAEIIDHLTAKVVAREIVVERQLPRELRFVRATPAPVRVETNPAGMTTVEWRLGDLLVGDEVSIEMEVEGIEQGILETDVDSVITYRSFRGVETSLSVPALTLSVVGPNLAPVAEYEFSPDNPTTADIVSFVDRSDDPDENEEVVSWQWDFGDGSTSDAQSPRHRFSDGGTYSVRLVAVDEQGLESTAYEAEIVVTPAPTVAAERTIETCLPNDEAVVGASVDVVISITINTTLNGLAVSEMVPVGWTFVEEDSDRATLRQSGQTVEWLFVEKLLADQANVQREIRYRLVAPSTMASSDLEQASIQGWLGSSSPRLEQPILGEDKLTLTRCLPIPVVISRWNTETEKLQLCEPEPEVIDFSEIQKAVSLWLAGETVPYTSDETIDLAMMQDLIAYWLTGSSVHDPLP